MQRKIAGLTVLLCCAVFSMFVSDRLKADPTITVDGSSGEWGAFDAQRFDDPQGDSTGADISGLSVVRQGDFFYILMTFHNGADKNPALRYFVNINTDDDGVSDFQVAVSYGSPGDTCRFKKDKSTYDRKRMDKAPGFKSAMGEAVEFQVPASMFNGRNAFRFWAGVWDTAKNAAVDTVGGYYTTLKIHYTLTVVDREKHLARIDAKFTGCPDESINLHFTPNYPQVGEIRIGDVKAAGADGSPLKIEHKNSAYRVTLGKSGRDFSLSYTLAMNQYHDVPVRGPAGYLCKGYMLTCTCWSLLSPVHADAKKYALTLKLPEDWVPVVPWKKAGDEFVETDAAIFRQTAFGAGDFEIRKKDITGTEVTVAVDSHYDDKFREELFGNCFMSFAFIKSVFGADVPKTHLGIFAKPEGPNEWQSYNESGLSEGEAVPDMNGAVYQYTHRVFHTFNGFYPYGMHTEPTWFMEGVNEYYCAIAKMKAKTEPPFKTLSDFYFKEYKVRRATLDAPLKGIMRFPDNWEKENFLAYRKGALAAMLLDLEIRRATQKAMSLKDLLSALHKSYGSFKGGKVTDEVIEKTASAVTGKNMKAFFGKYIYGSAPYDMDALFGDDDGDGTCNAAEELADKE